jgi:hypothetical protein
MSLLLVGVARTVPVVAANDVKLPVDAVVAPIGALLIEPPVSAAPENEPPVTVFPVKVIAVGKERTGVVPPVEEISFAVPLTLVTGAVPVEAAVKRP